MYACMMLFFVCNAIEGQLISTGAFEITFNGKLESMTCYQHIIFVCVFKKVTAALAISFVVACCPILQSGQKDGYYNKRFPPLSRPLTVIAGTRFVGMASEQMPWTVPKATEQNYYEIEILNVL